MLYLGLLRKANAHVWISSKIFARTCSLVVLWTNSRNSSINTLEATSSWMGEPQFLTTDSNTYSNRKPNKLLRLQTNKLRNWKMKFESDLQWIKCNIRVLIVEPLFDGNNSIFGPESRMQLLWNVRHNPKRFWITYWQSPWQMMSHIRIMACQSGSKRRWLVALSGKKYEHMMQCLERQFKKNT